MYRGDPEKSHMDVPPDGAVLDIVAQQTFLLEQNLQLCWLKPARNVAEK